MILGVVPDEGRVWSRRELSRMCDISVRLQTLKLPFLLGNCHQEISCNSKRTLGSNLTVVIVMVAPRKPHHFAPLAWHPYSTLDISIQLSESTVCIGAMWFGCLFISLENLYSTACLRKLKTKTVKQENTHTQNIDKSTQ